MSHTLINPNLDLNTSNNKLINYDGFSNEFSYFDYSSTPPTEKVGFSHSKGLLNALKAVTTNLMNTDKNPIYLKLGLPLNAGKGDSARQNLSKNQLETVNTVVNSQDKSNN